MNPYYLDDIIKNAHGDLNSNILEEIESKYKLRALLEPDEQIHYVGKSYWGPRITTDQINKNLGDMTWCLITSIGIRLIVYGDLNAKSSKTYGDYEIKFEDIKATNFNQGITKDSITITTIDDYEIKITEKLDIDVEFNARKRTTVQSPSIKFRLRARNHSGVPVTQIISFIDSYPERKIKAVEQQYAELLNICERLEYDYVNIPDTDSSDNLTKMEDMYDELRIELQNWESVESKYFDLEQERTEMKNKFREYFIDDCGDIVPSINKPTDFDTPKDASSEYTKLANRFTLCDDVMNSSDKNLGYKSIKRALLNSIIDDVQVNQTKEDLQNLQDSISTLSNLIEKTDEAPVEQFLDEILNQIETEGLPDSDQLEYWNEIIRITDLILEFMCEVDMTHPSVDSNHWNKSIELALEEQYLNVLLPIKKQIEEMNNGLWELDDLYNSSWQEFEELIASLYKSFGYATEVTSATSDMGVDVWARNSEERVAIQAKQYQQGNNVGRGTIQKLVSTLAKGDADRVIVVTTAEFAYTAKEYSDEFGSEVELTDGKNLLDKLNRSNIYPPT